MLVYKHKLLHRNEHVTGTCKRQDYCKSCPLLTEHLVSKAPAISAFMMTSKTPCFANTKTVPKSLARILNRNSLQNFLKHNILLRMQKEEYARIVSR